MSNKSKKVISVFTSIVTIAYMSGVAALAPMAASAAVAGVNEGDIIKVANNPDVYIAKYVGAKAFKRLVLSPSVFNSYGHLKWSNLKTVSQATMDQFTTSELARALGDTKVYKLTPEPNSDNGQKQWLNMSAEAFTAAGYDWDSIYVINNVDRDSYTAGADIVGAGATVTPVTGGALSVSLASDTPAAGVAVENAARMPFTKINLTAGSSDVSVTAITVQQTGLANDAAFSSIALIDAATNLQVGLNQSLNSSHQVVIRETITIPANTTKSYYLSGNMAASLDNYAGQLASLSLAAVETTATLSGALPITGNAQTINATLTIGTVTAASGSLNASTSTKEVGTTAFNFSAIKLTAGSTEDITITSIRFNQSGSAASSDLANIVVTDGTTNYATTVSSDGKYYTVSFGAGLVIAKGLSKEFTVKGDIVSGSNRTVSFDIYRSTDIVMKGNLYGYYITIATNTTYPWNTASNPVFNANNITIGTGSLRVDKNVTLAPAANITEGSTGAILGAFDFVVAGEAVNVSSITLTIATTSGANGGKITDVTLVKSDGTVLAGPNDPGATGASVAFTSTISFPVGTTPIIVKGTLDTTWAADDTVYLTMTPSTAVISVTGATTGNAITTTPASAVTANTMTVKGGALTVTVSSIPVAQDVVRGITGYTFANFIMDASGSGEDVKVTTMAITQTATAAGDVTTMQVFDGTTALNTGTNVVNPSATGAQTFTFDSGVIIPKGTIKTLVLKGNISGSATATNTQKWGLAASASITATGVSTTNTITAGGLTSAQLGQQMTIRASGQWSVALDSSTPTGKLIASNSAGNVVTVLRFKATAEAINISKIRLGLTSASTTGVDLANVYVYDGSTLLGSGTFQGTGGADGTGYNASTTFNLSPVLAMAANTEKVITIKADIASMDPMLPVATAGHVVAIDWQLNTSSSMNLGTGQSSGASIAPYSATTNQYGTGPEYIYRSVPTFSKLTLGSYTLSNGTVDLYKFRIAADAAGDIDIGRFSFDISTTGVVWLSSLTLVDVTSAETTLYASTTAAWGTGGTASPYQAALKASPGTPSGSDVPRTVSKGTYKDFVLRGTVSGATTGSGITTSLRGDIAFMTMTGSSYYMSSSSYAKTQTDSDFLWSDWSDTDHSTSATGNSTTDWTNGYLVSGMAVANTSSEVVSK